MIVAINYSGKRTQQLQGLETTRACFMGMMICTHNYGMPVLVHLFITVGKKVFYFPQGHIEQKAKRSYQKDIAIFKVARDSNISALDDSPGTAKEWEYESSSGYYYNQSSGCYYDPNSGFYYSDALGKWATREEAFSTVQVASDSKQKVPIFKKPLTNLTAQGIENKGDAPGPVISKSLNPMRTVKGASSSVTVGKRKRQDGKPKVVSAEEAAALKAREAAKKRVEEREKPLLGLYNYQNQR